MVLCVVVGVVGDGGYCVGSVGPGGSVGPPPMPGLVAIHHRVFDFVFPSS